MQFFNNALTKSQILFSYTTLFFISLLIINAKKPCLKSIIKTK